MRDKTNINRIYDSYCKQLYFTSFRIVGNSYDAQEIMHDTLIKYYSYANKESIEDLRRWLVSVCIRKSLDKLREKNRNRDFMEEYKQFSENEYNTYNSSITYTVENIKTAILKLPDNYRVILSLHLFEGFDYQEISQITGVKEVTIRTLYMRAKNKLVELIKK